MAAFRPSTTSKRVRRSRPTPKLVSRPQCAGITGQGTRCSRRVTASIVPGQPGKANLANYCKTHLLSSISGTGSSNLRRKTTNSSNTGLLSRCLPIFNSLHLLARIPSYVGAHARKSICKALKKGPSRADEPGYIYAFRVHGRLSFYSYFSVLSLSPDTSRPDIIRIKVGRTNDIVRRYKEHRRHCPSLRPTLLGYYPSNGENRLDLAAGRLRPNKKTRSSHLLERVVHRELTDVAIHAPYLSPNGASGGLRLGAAQTHHACKSCKCVLVVFNKC